MNYLRLFDITPPEGTTMPRCPKCHMPCTSFALTDLSADSTCNIYAMPCRHAHTRRAWPEVTAMIDAVNRSQP